MKVYVLVRGDKTMQTNIGAYESLYEGLIEAATTPTPNPEKSWNRSSSEDGVVLWICGDDWLRLEEMELTKKITQVM